MLNYLLIKYLNLSHRLTLSIKTTVFNNKNNLEWGFKSFKSFQSLMTNNRGFFIVDIWNILFKRVIIEKTTLIDIFIIVIYFQLLIFTRNLFSNKFNIILNGSTPFIVILSLFLIFIIIIITSDFTKDMIKKVKYLIIILSIIVMIFYLIIIIIFGDMNSTLLFNNVNFIRINRVWSDVELKEFIKEISLSLALNLSSVEIDNLLIHIRSIEDADMYYNAELLKKAKKKKSFLERYVLDDIERLTKHEILGLVVVILTSVLLYGVVSTYTDIGLPQLFTYKSTFKETLLIEGQVQSLALDYSFFPERMERWSKDFSIGLGKLNDVITAQKENASRLLELQLTVIKKLSRENPGDSVLKDIISESVNTLQKEKKEIPKNDELYKHFPSFK